MKRGRGQTLNKRDVQNKKRKLWKANMQCIITLHSHTVPVCRAELRDIHYLLLLNEDPCWERCRLINEMKRNINLQWHYSTSLLSLGKLAVLVSARVDTCMGAMTET